MYATGHRVKTNTQKLHTNFRVYPNLGDDAMLAGSGTGLNVTVQVGLGWLPPGKSLRIASLASLPSQSRENWTPMTRRITFPKVLRTKSKKIV
jgi:hypothetical protein